MSAAIAGVGVAAISEVAASAGEQAGTSVASPNTDKGAIAFLFVQSGFSPGSLRSNGDGTFELKLDSAPEQTIYFADRPDRLVGTLPTAKLQETLGFDPNDPPNAALVIAQDDGTTDTVVLELTDPAYDPTLSALAFTARVLEGYETLTATQTGFAETPLTIAEIPPTFGSSSLFIDSLTVGCSPWDPCC